MKKLLLILIIGILVLGCSKSDTLPTPSSASPQVTSVPSGGCSVSPPPIVHSSMANKDFFTAKEVF